MNRLSLACLLTLSAVSLTALAAGRSHAAGEIKWKKTVLDTHFRSEGCAIADVNKDGKPDILVGNLWFEAPTWKPHEIRTVPEFNGATGYSNAFLVFAMDVDKDGWVDEVVIDFPGNPAVWLKNPGNKDVKWQQFPVTDSACNETPNFADLDGDGQPELITPYKELQMAYYKPGATPEKGWEQHLIGEKDAPGCKRFSHGLGVGDVNGDGRPDILTTDGYYEQPADKNAVPWKFVPAKLGPPCAHIYAYDFNGDGKMDLFSSAAHQIGVWWWEQVAGPNGPEFRQHIIDNSFSQSHSDHMVDINGDGKPDFVTGKRFWAHGPNGDVNPGDPAVLYWYEFKKDSNGAAWTRHVIDTDSGVGTDFAVGDINGDGKTDIVTSNKKGVFLFEQVP